MDGNNINNTDENPEIKDLDLNINKDELPILKKFSKKNIFKICISAITIAIQPFCIHSRITTVLISLKYRLIQQINSNQYNPACDGLNNATPVDTYSDSFKE